MIEGRHFAAATMIGARKRQEDAWSAQVVVDGGKGEELLLAAVADGMGGLPAGDQASRITIRNFAGSYPLIPAPPAERLRSALATRTTQFGLSGARARYTSRPSNSRAGATRMPSGVT